MTTSFIFLFIGVQRRLSAAGKDFLAPRDAPASIAQAKQAH